MTDPLFCNPNIPFLNFLLVQYFLNVSLIFNSTITLYHKTIAAQVGTDMGEVE